MDYRMMSTKALLNKVYKALNADICGREWIDREVEEALTELEDIDSEDEFEALVETLDDDIWSYRALERIYRTVWEEIQEQQTT